jgi:hypothetical protein
MKRLAATKMNSLDLMFIESEVILSTMSKLMQLRIPSFPVHDSLIVKRGDAEAVLKMSMSRSLV